ncbi:unnamed protein product, partial [Thlaspi arvense]
FSSAQKELWKTFQNLKIGSNKTIWEVHDDAQDQFEKDHRLCLVVQGLNPEHQNPISMKHTLPKAWNLAGKLMMTVLFNFYFRSEHHLLTILENAPYTFKGWMVAIDRWNRRDLPTFLKTIPFWVRIENLPNVFRREQIVRSIGSKLGHVEEVEISEPTTLRPAEVWVKVRFNIDNELTLARTVQITRTSKPVELEFRYDVLQKFCTNCGSLKHSFDVCPHPPNLETQSFQLMQIDPVTSQLETSVVELPSSSGQAQGPSPEVSILAPVSSAPTLPSFPALTIVSSDQGESSRSMDHAIKFLSNPALNSTDMCITEGVNTFWCTYIYGNPVYKYLANCHWLDMFPTAYIQLLPWNGSDHRPLLIHTELHRKVGYKMFCYDNRWKCNTELSVELPCPSGKVPQFKIHKSKLRILGINFILLMRLLN